MQTFIVLFYEKINLNWKCLYQSLVCHLKMLVILYF